jgi:hypothetical protein
VTLALGLLAAVLVQLGLQSVHLPSLLATCQPVLLVPVAATRRFSPAGVAWVGLGVGLVTDIIAHRPIGAGGIAGALAGAAVATTVQRFELEGPLFWIVGSLLAVACSEAAWALTLTSLGATLDHGWLGSLAAFATTGAAGLAVAAGERLLGWWKSPERRRRRALMRR